MDKPLTNALGNEGGQDERTLVVSADGARRHPTSGGSWHLRHALVLLMMALLASGVIMGVAAGPAAKPAHADFCSDQAAGDRVAEYAYHHNWSPPPNHRGGGKYRNDDHKLPPSQYYKKYYVYPTSQHRPQRVVINTRTTRYWFSPDHYGRFYDRGYLNDNFGGGCF